MLVSTDVQTYFVVLVLSKYIDQEFKLVFM